jgi:hypothetical protein
VGRLVAALVLLAAHPLHTTLTQLEFRATDGTVQLTVRAFSDDLNAALRGDLSDSAAARYARSNVTLLDGSGHRLPLVWCGARRGDGVVWLCLRGAAPVGAGRLRLRVSMLFDVYADEINIIQTSHDGRRGGALLFTRGDAPKAVP